MTLETTVTMPMGSEIGPTVTALEPLDVDAIVLNCATGPNSRQFTMPLARLGSMAKLL